jgi:hypothetical protein
VIREILMKQSPPSYYLCRFLMALAGLGVLLAVAA